MRNTVRDEAITRGETRYFLGTPCVHGHIAERMVSSRRCVVCNDLASKEWKASNPEACNSQKQKWSERNREKVRALKRSYYANSEVDRAQQAVRARKWLEANREKSRAASAKWRRSHLATAAAAASRRKAKLLQRTPPWADHEKIQQFYDLARKLTEETGVIHEVDHIVPLQGKTVSGFHVHDNLQILTRQANRAKGARFVG